MGFGMRSKFLHELGPAISDPNKSLDHPRFIHRGRVSVVPHMAVMSPRQQQELFWLGSYLEVLACAGSQPKSAVWLRTQAMVPRLPAVYAG